MASCHVGVNVTSPATALRTGVSINWLSLSALWRAVITAPMGIPGMAAAFRIGISLAETPQYYRAVRLRQLML